MRSGYRDLNILESAVTRARMRYTYSPQSTVAQLAAAYAYGIARDHPFIDGNKRTAYLVAEAFCNLNDWRLDADDVESIIIFRPWQQAKSKKTSWQNGSAATSRKRNDRSNTAIQKSPT
jgi:death-on-curing family protein